MYALLLSQTSATHSVSLILLGSMSRIIFGEEKSSYSSSICSLLHSRLLLRLPLGPKYTPQYATLDHPQHTFRPQFEKSRFVHIENNRQIYKHFIIQLRSRKQRLMAVGIRCTDHVTPLYPQKLALTSPTGGGRFVGIVRSRTKATELVS